MKIPTGVSNAIDNYWRAGIVSGLLVFDAAVLWACLVDVIRFMLRGFSFATAFDVGLEAALDGNSVGLTIAVFVFFVVALPTVAALLSVLVSPVDRWPRFLRGQGKGILATHLVLSGLIALLTMTTVAMEVLSGWAKAKTMRYSFISIWLGVVLMGRPVYVFYISPIIRKFLVRLPGGHKAKFTEVIQEVVTEERIGGEH
jgi:hypothetical protein